MEGRESKRWKCLERTLWGGGKGGGGGWESDEEFRRGTDTVSNVDEGVFDLFGVAILFLCVSVSCQLWWGGWGG